MKKILKKILLGFDWCLERVWELLGFMCLIIWCICCLFGRGAVLLWHRLGKVGKCHGVWLKFSSFFRFMETAAALILIYPVRWFVVFKKRLDNSAGVRRTMLLVVVIIYLIIRQPFLMPWDWGVWDSYQRGVASWYGSGFYFSRTASGEFFLPGPFMTAAHKTLPFGTRVLVRNISNGRKAVVTINDDGPHIKGRIIDLSWFAAWRLGITGPGTALVVLSVRPETKRVRAKK